MIVGEESERSRSGYILRLCAEVVRAAAGLEDDEHPVLEVGAEVARMMAIRARGELDKMRADDKQGERDYLALQDRWDGLKMRCDRAEAYVRRLQAYIDKAGDDMNVCALLDKYHERYMDQRRIASEAAERDRALTARIDDLERALRHLLLSRDVAWDGGGHDWDDAVRDAQRLLAERRFAPNE